ncbi:roadblock/LC7 domain-containing protein [Streptomyces sp. YS415]|uniref:roadblock/LC7 domain-containing protein n=1 Tax=Streptomyces sp. YS415 TaxID=2944806 RepID=UPI002021AAC8|nr:roadblock/LC7 domain-containing protein [Streptomyces sp. YS415]MCL7430329.1 roadblock/LC7 domain-containing protein [Streptomyces sp. YS415]
MSTHYDHQPLRSSAVDDFNWLLEHFATQTAGVREVVAVSSDGLLLAGSRLTDRAEADRLAAVISGITSLSFGAAANRDLGTLDKVIIDFSGGYLLVTVIGAGCVLGVVAHKSAGLGTLAYEMTLFAERAATTLTPLLIDELKSSVQS